MYSRSWKWYYLKISFLDSLPRITIFKHDFYTDDPTDGKLRAKQLEIRCKAEGLPAPTIDFQYNGMSLRNATDPRVIMRSENDLILNNVSESDSGTYRCVASNALGVVFKQQYIKMHGESSYIPCRKII